MPNTFIVRLHQVISQNPVQRKVLIAQSFAQGHQWLERISRMYGPVMNTEVQTLESLAVSRAERQLGEKNIRLLSAEECFWMVHSIMNELASLPDSCVPASMVTPGVVRCFRRLMRSWIGLPG